MGGNRHGGSLIRPLVRIGAAIEQALHDLEIVVAPERMVECRGAAPAGVPVRIGAVGEEVVDPLPVVQVRLAQEQCGHAVGRQLPALDEGAHRHVVVGLGRVIRRFLVVRIGAALEEEPRQRGVARDAGGAVDRALPYGRRTMRRVKPAGVRIRPGVEERRRGAKERIGARPIELEVLREAEIGEAIPAARPAIGRRASRIGGEESPDGLVAAGDGCREDTGLGDFGMRGEDGIRAVERTVPMRRAVHRHPGRLDELVCRLAVGHHVNADFTRAGVIGIR